MEFRFFGNKKAQERFFLTLDIGTEAVKVLIFSTSASPINKISILAASSQYFERYGVFDGRDFETDIIKKAILKAVEEARKKIFFSLARRDLKNKVQKQKKWQILLGISSNKLKGRVVSQNFVRENSRDKISKKEEKVICQEVLKRAEKEISQKFAQESGILPSDIYWISLKIIEMKIDGYLVSTFQGYEGENLEFKILATFLPKYYLERIKKIIESLGMEILKIVHPVENLSFLCEDDREDGIFLDVGGRITQFFLVRGGILQQIGEFEGGGKIFTETLSQDLGINEESARILKERYSNGLLNIETVKKMKEIFIREKKNWYLCLKNEVKKLNQRNIFPLNIYLFGGGSLLPEIKEILEEKITSDSKGTTSQGSAEIKFIHPKDFKNIKKGTVNLKDPQIISSLLICHHAKEIL